MQNDTVAVADHQPGGHLSEAICGAGYEDTVPFLADPNHAAASADVRLFPRRAATPALRRRASLRIVAVLDRVERRM